MDNVLPLKRDTQGILPVELKDNIGRSLNDVDGKIVNTVEAEINSYIVGKAVKAATSLGEVCAVKIAKWIGLV